MSMNLIFTRGDTKAFKFQRKDANHQVITEIADELYFTVKKSWKKEEAVIQKSLEDITFDSDYWYHVVISSEDTAELPYGNYVFDIEVTQGDYVQTIGKGTISLEEEATWQQNKNQG